MAKVHVTLSRVDDRGDTGGSLPIITSVPENATTVDSSGTSAVVPITATKADGLVWSVTATGNVMVRFGVGTPVAVEGQGHLITAGQTRDFSVTALNETIAVKDVA